MKTFTNSVTLILFSSFLTVSTAAQAQNYKASIGPRIGIKTYGISASYFINDVASIDGIFSIGHDNKRVLFTALYEEHYTVGNITPAFRILCGAGIHVGVAREGDVVYNIKYRNVKGPENMLLLGADAIAGIEYKFNKMPISLGIDIKPTVDFINGPTMLFDGGARLTFTF